jgi:hypothetical protein
MDAEKLLRAEALSEVRRRQRESEHVAMTRKLIEP